MDNRYIPSIALLALTLTGCQQKAPKPEAANPDQHKPVGRLAVGAFMADLPGTPDDYALTGWPYHHVSDADYRRTVIAETLPNDAVQETQQCLGKLFKHPGTHAAQIGVQIDCGVDERGLIVEFMRKADPAKRILGGEIVSLSYSPSDETFQVSVAKPKTDYSVQDIKEYEAEFVNVDGTVSRHGPPQSADNRMDYYKTAQLDDSTKQLVPLAQVLEKNVKKYSQGFGNRF